MEFSDEELVRLHIGGHRTAFRQLVERYAPSIYGLALSMTGDRMEAEDLSQETFLRVYTALPGSRLDLPFRPWLFRIAINLCRNWAKKKKPLSFSKVENRESDDRVWLVDTIPDDAPLPLDRVLHAELRQALEESFASLPFHYRLAIVLRYTEDLSYREMAHVLGLPLNTVRTHLFRAKRLLRKELQARLGRVNDEL